MATRTATLRALALLSLLGLAPAAPAQQQDRHAQGRLSYTWAEARLVDEEPEGGGDFTGVRVGGAAQFHPNLFFTGALTSVSNDGVDIDTLDLGLGFRQALNSATDLVAGVGLVWADIDAGRFGGDDDTGLSLSGGVRSFLAPRFEVGAYATYVELFGDGDISIVGEGLLHMTPQLGLVGSLSLSDDVNVVTAGARWNFSQTR